MQIPLEDLNGKVKTGGMEGLEDQKTFLGILARWTLEEIVFIEKSFLPSRPSIPPACLLSSFFQSIYKPNVIN
jgi:hypothetical protein